MEPLRLRAEDEEDLAVLSACLQDGLVAVGDMAYEAADNCFRFVANRFRWECREATGARTLAGITIEGVTGARRRGFDPKSAEAILVLLSLAPAPGCIELVFAGGASVRLDVPDIRVRLQDLGEEWPTRFQPAHS